MKIKDQKAIFSSTGNEVEFNCGIVGLGPDMTVYEGYDDSIYHQPSEYLDEELSDLTTGEQVELAEHMIEQWQKFKALAEKESSYTIKGNRSLI